jgi:DNA-binding IclR family transcriptional regulator
VSDRGPARPAAPAGTAGTAGSAGPAYSAPALDKALDILELLADASEPMTQSAVADAVGRNVSQIYRVLATLERRGLVVRDPASGRYGLSMALFDLAHRHAPLRGLVQAASGPMRRLADEVRQSCNLGVDDGGAVRIIAQAESPADFGFRVRVGALFPMEGTAAGAVLLFGGARRADASGAGAASGAGFVPASGGAAGAASTEAPQLEAGFLTRVDGTQPGITDVVAAIVGHSGRTLAALTVPYVSTSYSAVPLDAVVSAARAAAHEITTALGGAPGTGHRVGGR